MPILCIRSLIFVLVVVLGLAGCAELPTTGPARRDVSRNTSPDGGANLVQVVDLTSDVLHRLASAQTAHGLSDLPMAHAAAGTLGPGDAVAIDVWEAPPAALFGVSALSAIPGAQIAGADTSHGVTLPEQVIDRDGNLRVPFAGVVHAAGHSLPEVAAAIVHALKGKANAPEVVVRQTRYVSSSVTVVGEVVNSVRMPLTAAGEHVLDALAAAGGTRQPINKVTIQVSRGTHTAALPLARVIEDPTQNIRLHPGDVVTVLFQPYSYTALGATGKNDEIPFEAQGISLSQAVARAGGLVDNRSDAQALYVFRLAPREVLPAATSTPLYQDDQGRVPIAFHVDLRNPVSFFLMQQFAMADHDTLYVSDASTVEAQKFLNLVFSAAYPLTAFKQLAQ
jgi:polysaccharide export outer membrane protein